MNEERKYLRHVTCEVRADQNEEHGHFIVGKPIVFNSRTDIGYFDEIIDSGALATTDLKDVRFLVNHNLDMIPLARSRNNNENSTMQLTVGDDGVTIRADLDTEHNSTAAELYSAVSRGDISGMSFMFSVDGEKWDGLEEDHPLRTITSIKHIFEVSAVTAPAYGATTIEARSDAEALESAKAALESARNAQAEAEKDAKIKALEERINNLAKE